MTYRTDKYFLDLVQAGLVEDALRELHLDDPPMDAKHLAKVSELLMICFLEDFADQYFLQVEVLK